MPSRRALSPPSPYLLALVIVVAERIVVVAPAVITTTAEAIDSAPLLSLSVSFSSLFECCLWSYYAMLNHRQAKWSNKSWKMNQMLYM